jgi:hypothetical protein
MTIRQYYQETASINLNGSIVSGGMLLIMLSVSMLLSWNIPFLVVAVPFLSISFYQYIRYRLYRSRSESCKKPKPLFHKTELFTHNDLLISFYPAPAVRLLFFTPDGMLAGELKEAKVSKWRWLMPYFLDRQVPKKIGIYGYGDKLQGWLLYDGKEVKMVSEHNEVIGFYYPHKKADGSNGIALLTGGRKLICGNLSGMEAELLFKNKEGITASKLQKGWMPLEWTHYFKDANTPVLTFDYSLSAPERMAVFAALAHHYLYYNH